MRSSRLDAIKNWSQRVEVAQFRIAKLAKNCGVSERQMERYIHSRFGETPQHWVTRKRMEIARERLLAGALVKEAAAQVLYGRPSHFTRAFRRFYDQNPSEARSGSR
jgi:AraC-like DNA-binding protein